MLAAAKANIPFPDDNERFLVELEFIQLLCNLKYLQHLAQHKYFENESFLEYLKYLKYWQQPQYLKYITFPQCLTFLDMILEKPKFREALKSQQFVDYVHQQQGSHWMNGPPL